MNTKGSIRKTQLSRLFEWPVFAFGAAILAYSVFGIFANSFAHFAAFGIAIVISVLVSKHEGNIPKTKIKFTPKLIFTFLGFIMFGASGGMLLTASAGLATFRKFKGSSKGLILSVCRDLICASIGALTFFSSLNLFRGLDLVHESGRQLIPTELIAAAVLMVVSHLAVSAAMGIIEHRINGVRPSPAVPVVLGYLISFAATFVLFLAFSNFGFGFGLVLLPIAVFGNIAYVMHSRSLESKTKQLTEASRLHLATVEALATAIDARDQVGVGHVRRVQIYAVGLGEAMKLSTGEINALRTGALLHDIGKLAVPDHILNKPGRLTRGEMEKAKIHSDVGASILETIGFEYPVVPTVRYHHEFWDGSGYPKGLKGNKIPITARILMVANSFDSLRCDRPYRPAVSREDACNFLRAGSGTQFDPNVVTTFLKNLANFEAEIEFEGVTYMQAEAVRENGMAVVYPDPAPAYVEQIQRANREVFTLYEMAREFSSAQDLDETLALFTSKVRDFVPFDTCLVYLLESSGRHAYAAHIDGINSSELSNIRIKVGEGATGYVLKKNKPVENVDPGLDFAFTHWELSQQYIAMASVPLVADGKLIGAISLYSIELGIYEEEHLRLLETISRIAADTIGKSLRQAETESRAITDPMTHLPNARGLQIQFDKEVARARRGGTTFQLLMLDLDGFKAVNDNFGHKIGDQMLLSIGGVIKNELRDYDFLARYGGDEFVAIIPGTDSSDVLELCRRIEDAVCSFKLPVGDHSIARVGVSIGTANFPIHGESYDQLVISADKAMYSTKKFHKQRESRLEEQRMSSRMKAGPLPADDPIILENDIDPIARDIDLVVELDESHIVSFGSVN